MSLTRLIKLFSLVFTALLSTASLWSQNLLFDVIKSALNDNKCVDTHWFMYANSTAAGRSAVGENANCGVVSETDTPYYELTNRIKLITHKLYQYRWNEN